MKELVHEGLVMPADAAASPYLYLPVEVFEGITRIDVRLEHDPGSVIDLGLLDPRATGFPSRSGFRGWSGGARDRIFVASDDATPGYIPGPIPAGTWHVVLGLYRIRPEGCRYRVEAVLDDSPRQTIPPAPAQPSFPVAPGWYPGDLQSHTWHSDAKGSLEDLVAAARSRGLRFLAVTDHNTISHHRYLASASSAELFLLPGEEVTTDRGHANVWGGRDWVDFRITEDDQVNTVVQRAHELGGLISINHPKPGGPDWRYPVPAGVDCVEAWQAPWPAGNETSLEFYDRMLGSGARPVLVGGSDRHQPGWPDTDPPYLQVGSPTTWLWLEELSVPACLAALKSGRVFVSESPEGPRLELWLEGVAMGGTLQVDGAFPEGAFADRAAPGAEAAGPAGGNVAATASLRIESHEPVLLRLMGRSGELVRRRLPAGKQSVELELPLAEAGPFMRAELWDAEENRVVALSNPVFIQPQPAR
ncbi:MAG: CehA/McbA family metallohydrolase [Trueperaceae bacterium]